MPGGRPLKPTALKRSQGTLRKHRQNKREPKLPSGAPSIPSDLDSTACAEWRRLVIDTMRMKVLTESDRAALYVAAGAYSVGYEAERRWRKEGMTFESETSSGASIIKAHPAVAIASDAWRRYFAAICALGLTPAARQKVSTVDQAEEEDPAERYFN